VIGEENKENTGNKVNKGNQNQPDSKRFGKKTYQGSDNNNQKRNKRGIDRKDLRRIFTINIKQKNISQDKGNVNYIVLGVLI
jgi:hypothetical protein